MIARSKNMHIFHFTKASPKWMDKHSLSCNVWEFLYSTFLPTFGIINLFIFIKLMGMMSHYDADFNFPNYQQSLSSYHMFIGQSSLSFYGIFLHPLPMFLCGCLFLIIPWMVNIHCKYLSQSETCFWFTELLNFNVVNFSFILFFPLFCFAYYFYFKKSFTTEVIYSLLTRCRMK